VRFERAFNKFINDVMKVILYILASIVMLIIIFQLGKLILELKNILFEFVKTDESSKNAVVSVLNLFILIEFFRGIISYFEFDRLKISYITDAALVFIIREIMIVLFYKHLDLNISIAYSIIVLSLAALRTLSIIYTPDREKKKFSKQRNNNR
jgi:uncharacterized membrane protein (DUF373 family)